MRHSRFERLLDALAWICTAITGIALIVLTVIFGWLVYGRYVLNATPTWVEQVSLLLVVLITFLGAATGVRQNTHLSVGMFRDNAPKPVAFACKLISHLAMLAFGLVMAVQGFQLAQFKWATQIPLIHLPEGLRAVPAAICGGLLALFALGHLIRLIKGMDDYQIEDGD